MPDPFLPKPSNPRKRRKPNFLLEETQQAAAALPTLSIAPNSFDYLFQGRPAEPVTPQRNDKMTPCSSPSVSKHPKSSASTASHAAGFADKQEQNKTPASSEPAPKNPGVAARRSARQMRKMEEEERERLIQAVGELHKEYKPKRPKVVCNSPPRQVPDMMESFQPTPKRPRGAVEEFTLCKEDIIQYSADLKAAADIAIELDKTAKAEYTTNFLEGLFRAGTSALQDDKEAGRSLDFVWIPDSTIPIPVERLENFKGREDQLQSATIIGTELPAVHLPLDFDNAEEMQNFSEPMNQPPTSYDDVPMINNMNPGMPYFEDFQPTTLCAFGCKSEAPISTPFPPLSVFKASDAMGPSHLSFDCTLLEGDQTLHPLAYNASSYSHGSSNSIGTNFQPAFDGSNLPDLVPETGPHHISELEDLALLNGGDSCLQSVSGYKINCLDLAGDIYLGFGVDDSLLALPETDDTLLGS